MAKFCKYCGAPLDENMEFCKQCGKPVRKGNPQGGRASGQTPNSYGKQSSRTPNPYGGQSGQRPNSYGGQYGQTPDPYGRQSNKRSDPYGGRGRQPWDPYGEQPGRERDFYGGMYSREPENYGRQAESVSDSYERKSGRHSKKRKDSFKNEKHSGKFKVPRSVIPLGIVFGGIAVILVILLVLLVLTLRSDGVDTSSPENVVGSFYEKLEDQDMEGALACFSSEEAAKKFDYESYVDLYDSEDQSTLMPSEDTKIQLINERKLEGQAADQIASTIRVIGLGEDTGKRSIQGVGSWQELGVEKEDYIESVDTGNLKDLTVERVELAAQKTQNQDETQERLEQEAKVYGADERREYVALFTVGETSYIQGFTLDRYGEDWKIFSLTSELAGTSSYGVPTVADQSSDFEKYTK